MMALSEAGLLSEGVNMVISWITILIMSVNNSKIVIYIEALGGL